MKDYFLSIKDSAEEILIKAVFIIIFFVLQIIY